MESTAQQQQVQGLAEYLKSACTVGIDLGIDLQISAFQAALASYRRASVATPFPSQLFPGPAPESSGKDFAGCTKALEALPHVQQLANPDVLQGLPPKTVSLLHWLLLPSTRRRVVLQQISEQEFRQRLQQTQPGVKLPILSSTPQTPVSILENASASQQSLAQSPQVIVAYHGTSFENVHSILNSGLVSMSGSRLMRNGAIFGEGIYLSSHLEVATTFAPAQPCWRYSNLGSKCSCVFVCAVDMTKATVSGSDGTPAAPQHSMDVAQEATAAVASASQPVQPEQKQGINQSRGQQNSPDGYIIVQRADALKILYVLVYGQRPAQVATEASTSSVPWLGGRRLRIPRISAPAAVILLYVVFMVVQALLSSPWARRLWLAWRGRANKGMGQLNLKGFREL